MLQVVTNRKLYSVDGRTNQYLEEAQQEYWDLDKHIAAQWINVASFDGSPDPLGMLRNQKVVHHFGKASERTTSKLHYESLEARQLDIHNVKASAYF